MAWLLDQIESICKRILSVYISSLWESKQTALLSNRIDFFLAKIAIFFRDNRDLLHVLGPLKLSTTYFTSLFLLRDLFVLIFYVFSYLVFQRKIFLFVCLAVVAVILIIIIAVMVKTQVGSGSSSGSGTSTARTDVTSWAHLKIGSVRNHPYFAKWAAACLEG